MPPEPTPLPALLTTLAADAIRTQALLDQAHQNDLRDWAAAWQRAFPGAAPEATSAWIQALETELLPRALRVGSWNVAVECELAVNRERAGSVAVRPLNAGYLARFGSTQRWSSRLQIQVEPTPWPEATPLSTH